MAPEKIEIEYVDIEILKPSEYNPNKMTEDQKRKLKKNIQEMGFCNPIIANKHQNRENIIIGGHHRVEIAKELGYTQIPVIYVDMDEQREKLLNMSLNRIKGEFLEDRLVELMKELDEQNIDLSLTGFTDREIDRLLEEYREGKEEPPMPEKVQSKVKPGDIWELESETGLKHKIMCCDNTIESNYSRLIGDEIIDLVLTDPPYNLEYKYHSFKDNSTQEEYEKTIRKWFGIIKPISEKILITCGPQNTAMWCRIEKPKWIIAWLKRNANSGCALRGFNKWEPIVLYGKFEPVLFYGNIDKIIPWDVVENADFNQREDVYDIRTAFIEDSNDGFAGIHSCPKPTKLFARLIKDFTRTRNSVLDIFLGSGTNLIACEKTKRTCYGMEIDEYYVSLSIIRWINYTGNDKNVYRMNPDGTKTYWNEINSE